MLMLALGSASGSRANGLCCYASFSLPAHFPCDHLPLVAYWDGDNIDQITAKTYTLNGDVTNSVDTKGQLERLAGRDPFVRWLGATVDRAAPGEVTLTTTVREEHMSFNGTCHGGVLFSLADAAFGLASNSHGVIAVGIHTDMAFCAPARVGDIIVAEAKEVSRSKRVGVYRVLLTKQDGTTVAMFTGTVHRTAKVRDE